MSHRVVFITGALTGVGRATAFAFAREQATIVACGRHGFDGATLIAELVQSGAAAEFLQLDDRGEESIRRLVDRGTAQFGRIDVAVNIAGLEGQPGPFSCQTAQVYSAMIDAEATAASLCTRHELRVMLTQRAGTIVNVSSPFAHAGVSGASLQSASRRAIETLTRSASLEAASAGVRVNAVVPVAREVEVLSPFAANDARKVAIEAGVVVKRLESPQEIAESIVFLASDKASHMTGRIIS